jgi:superfamily II DNA or RNA helicase
MRVPAPEQLDEARAEVALRELGFPVPADRAGWSAPALALAPTVRGLPQEPVPAFAVGAERVRHRGAGPITAGTLVCSCGGRACVHVAAALIVVAFDDPTRRAAFEEPPWALALQGLASPPATAPLAPPAQCRFVVRAPTPGGSGLQVEARLVRVDAGGREVVGRAPRAGAELRALRGPSDRDGVALDALAALEQARRARVSGLVRHLARRLVVALADVRDLRFEETPIRATADPTSPRLVAEGAAGSDLALGWSPPIRVVWPEDVVLRADGVLAPLGDDVPAAVAERLGRPLPAVPAAEVPTFVARMVVDRGLAVTLPAWLDPVGPPDARGAAIALSEDGATLRVDLALSVTRGGAGAAVDPTDPADTVRIAGGGIARRDRAWERAETERFRADVGGPLRLTGAAAHDWLAEVLPALAATWEVRGEDRLVRHRLRGALVPRVRFTEGTDWFDLDVTFQAGGAAVGGAEVVRAWRSGARWIPLDDGGVAALPAAWLARHAEAVDLLAEVRRAQRGLGSWHAWTVSDLLREEVGAPAARWLAAFAPQPPADRRPPPPGLAAALRPYQQEGFEWLCGLRDRGLHGLLADEMGLGKTLQALAFLLDTPRTAPALVVAPTSMLHAWRDEAARFAPSLRTLAWHGPDRQALDPAGADLVITSYALLRRDADRLAARDWSVVVLDEAQALKNPASLTARAARRLPARHRLALTGTPVENDLSELWSLFQFLLPGYLGRRSAFHARHQAAARRDAAGPLPPAAADLARRIRPFVLRRRKAEVAPDLPPRTDLVLRVSLSDRERRLYEVVRSAVRSAASAAPGDGAHHGAAVLLEGLTRLRQACCHPALLPLDEARTVARSAKVEALLDQLDAALPAGERVLVFSQWVRMLDEVDRALATRGIPSLRLDGSTRDRAAVVAAFQRPDGPPVLTISITAGGTGLTLTAADRVVLLDPWWNPAVEEQAAARAHRLGRDRPVTVVRLVAADTVEEKVLALQAHKRRLFAATIDAPEGPALDADDLRALLADA